MTSIYPDEIITELEASFLSRNDKIIRWGNAIASMQALPGLRGLWPMSAFSAVGDAFDQSGNGRTLTYNGNPVYNYDEFVPFIDLDGVGDFLSRADEAGLDITGTETYVAGAAQGLTMGCWSRIPSLPGANAGMMAKDDLAVNRSYLFFMTPAGTILGQISTDGFTIVNTPITTAVSTNTWFHVVIRFVPSTTANIYLNGVRFSNAVGIPASIHSGSATFTVGSLAASLLINADFSLCFLCAAALSDIQIISLFEQQRTLFGV